MPAITAAISATRENGSPCSIESIARFSRYGTAIARDAVRIKHAPPSTNLPVSAKVTDPSGVQWVRLRYRHLTQFEDYQTLEMSFNPQTGLYTAEIPGEFIIPEWDLMYFLEVIDTNGNGRMIPDFEKEMPYVIVELER